MVIGGKPVSAIFTSQPPNVQAYMGNGESDQRGF